MMNQTLYVAIKEEVKKVAVIGFITKHGRNIGLELVDEQAKTHQLTYKELEEALVEPEE